MTYAAIEAALVEHGVDLADGRRTVLLSKVRPLFEVRRQAVKVNPKHRKELDRDALRLGLKKLVAKGVIALDAEMVWFPG